MQYPFSKWWFHGHINYPPNDGDFLEVPAGGTLNTEIACDKGATSYFASSPGGNIQSGDNPCPGSPTVAFHAHNIEDTRGCGLAIAYKNDINAIQPADFTIFSVNQTCVWNRFTNFDIPNLPACPEGGCFCGFFWIHAADAGSAQIYMNAYRCVVNGATSTVPLATSRIPRRCGADPDFGKPNAAPWNCTYGAKQPMYWYQSERNNMFEDAQQPPSFNDMYHFLDGRQDDIFQNSEIPVFNENGDQAGVTTLGSGTATTANIVTPSVSGGWSTTVSSLPDETSAPSASNASPNSSSAAVSSSSDKTNPPSSSNASPSSSSAAASSSPDETNVPSSSNPGPSSSPAVASSSPTSSESITTDAVQPSPSPSPSTGTGTSDSNTSGVNSNVSTPGSSSSSSPISNPTPSNSSSPAPGSPATCRRRKPSIDKRALGVHRNRLSKKLNL
ncbi:hypothetical protein EW145_g2125 [Phellinidium pouzarii]|uniref:Uncharacterized protein n=1 Tax=Phellinidium pouzarii TaxID=167371 RepID=A0A4S4LBY8_9AGAM|nr:hypothetical protein EW145_g2125 [Phellinidium pouzarii]